MPDGLRLLFSARSPAQIAIDLVDVFIVAYLVYRVLLVLRGTKAMQVGFGLLSLGGIYVVGRSLGLVTLVSLLSTLLSSIILVVVVVFQADIRRALMRVGGRPLFMGLQRDDEAKVIEEVIAAVTELARLRHGAIITWEREANLEEFYVGAGTAIDAAVSRELLVTIFVPVGENKLHDGAVIIRNLRVARAGVFYPMPEKHNLDKQFGSRHRAAIGITADTDAIAIVVSEERGTIMFAFQENHVDNVTPDALRNLLRRYEPPKSKRSKPKGVPPSSRRSLPPAVSQRGPTPPPPAVALKGAGPVIVRTPPPGSVRPSSLTPSPGPTSDRDPHGQRPSIPPPSREVPDEPPEEGTDQ